MGGIYAGAFTAMEAAGMGAAGAFLFALARRMISLRRLAGILIETARTTAVMFVILFGALLFSNFVEAAGLPAAMSQWLRSLAVAPIVVIAAIVAVYVVLGTALEGVSMVLLTVPIFFPIVTGLGYDPVWFGILVVVVAEISLITPPVGLNYSIITAMVPDVSTREVVRGLYPFMVAEILLVAILVAFPYVVLVLPSQMR
jgi:C4-dicarboxylate transporter, DctM subunit